MHGAKNFRHKAQQGLDCCRPDRGSHPVIQTVQGSSMWAFVIHTGYSVAQMCIVLAVLFWIGTKA